MLFLIRKEEKFILREDMFHSWKQRDIATYLEVDCTALLSAWALLIYMAQDIMEFSINLTINFSQLQEQFLRQREEDAKIK